MEALSKILSQTLKNDGTCQSKGNLDELKVEAINETVGELQHYDCPVCKNRGYVAELRDGNIVCRECKCMPVRRSMRNISKSGLQSLLSACTFETYRTPSEWQKDARSAAERFTEDDTGKWFMACGSVGSGKTHLCTAICGELLKKGVEVRYMLWRDESVKLKACVNENAEYHKMIHPLKTVRALYIDDFFKTEQGKNPTTADINLAFEILNARYANKYLITIISTEKSPEELLEIDEAIGSRIYERIRGYCVRIEGKDKNWRLNT